MHDRCGHGGGRQAGGVQVGPVGGRAAEEREHGAIVEIEVRRHLQIGDRSQRQAADDRLMVGGQESQVTTGRVADEHHPGRRIDAVTGCGHCREGKADVIDGGIGITGNPAVLHEHGRVSGGRQGGGHRPKMRPVVLGTPVAAVDEHDERPPRCLLAGWGQIDVSHLRRVRPVVPRPVGPASRPVQHASVLSHGPSMAIDLH